MLKYVKNLIATALIDPDTKMSIYRSFQSVVYSRTEEEAKITEERLLIVAADIKVRRPAGQGQTQEDRYIAFNDYYLKNWAPEKEEWSHFARRQLVTLGDDTTNRVESTFRNVKSMLQSILGNYFPISP